MSEFQSNLPALLPGYLMVAATPLYGLSSVLGMAQTLQGIATTASTAAAGAADVAGQAAAEVAGAADAVGAGLVGSMGQAASLGSLSVPASWTSVIPTAHLTGAGAELANAGGAGGMGNVPPSLLGGLPRGATGRRASGPAVRADPDGDGATAVRRLRGVGHMSAGWGSKPDIPKVSLATFKLIPGLRRAFPARAVRRPKGWVS